MKQEYLFEQTGGLGDIIGDGMDDDAFVRGVSIFARHIDPEILKNPDKKRGVKRQIYSASGRCYFRKPDGNLVHRIITPLDVLGRAFRDDYVRLIETEKD